MRAIIPDTLEGAVILSLIDFFLSFVIIAGIGVVLSFFPLLNRFGAKGKEREHAPETTGAAESSDVSAQHLVAISAAIHEVIGPHRIVGIQSSEKRP